MKEENYYCPKCFSKMELVMDTTLNKEGSRPTYFYACYDCKIYSKPSPYIIEAQALCKEFILKYGPKDQENAVSIEEKLNSIIESKSSFLFKQNNLSCKIFYYAEALLKNPKVQISSDKYDDLTDSFLCKITNNEDNFYIEYSKPTPTLRKKTGYYRPSFLILVKKEEGIWLEENIGVVSLTETGENLIDNLIKNCRENYSCESEKEFDRLIRLIYQKKINT